MLKKLRYTALGILLACTASVVSGQQADAINEQLVPFADATGKWGYMDAATHHVVIQPAYYNVELFKNNRAVVSVFNPAAVGTSEYELYGLIDTAGRRLLPMEYTGFNNTVQTEDGKRLDGVMKFFSANKYCVIDSANRPLIPTGDYKMVRLFSLHHLLADNNTLYAYGRPYTVPPGFEVERIDTNRQYFFLKKDDLHHGVYSWSGAVIVPANYLHIQASDSAGRLLAMRPADTSFYGKNEAELLAFLDPEKGKETILCSTDLYDTGGNLIANFRSRYEPDLGDSLAHFTENGVEKYISLATGKVLPHAPSGGNTKYTIFTRVMKAQRHGNEEDSKLHGLMDSSGHILVPPLYSKLEMLDEHCIIARLAKNGHSGTLDVHNRVVIPFRYISIDASRSGRLIAADSSGKYGMIDREGNVLIKFVYDLYFYFQENGQAMVYRSGRQGVIDTTGKTIIPVEYSSINNTRELEKTSRSFYAVEKNGQWGMLDSTGKLLIPLQYGYVYPGEGTAGNNWMLLEDEQREHRGAINLQTGDTIPVKYTSLAFNEQLIAAGIYNNGNYQYDLLDKNGRKLPLEGLTDLRFQDGYWIAQKGTLMGLLNSEGREILPFKYSYLWVDSPHLIKVEENKQVFYINTNGTAYKMPG